MRLGVLGIGLVCHSAVVTRGGQNGYSGLSEVHRGPAWSAPSLHRCTLRGSGERELPAWLEALVGDVWEEPKWNAWETQWKPRLLKHGVTPEGLQPVGDPSRPRWDEGERTAVLSGLRRLVVALERGQLGAQRLDTRPFGGGRKRATPLQ
jgi:hypothetical protein